VLRKKDTSIYELAMAGLGWTADARTMFFIRPDRTDYV
jgi:hypothetical protein